MRNLVKPMGKFIELLAFLPITPSIAALTVFTQSVVNKSSTESISIPYYGCVGGGNSQGGTPSLIPPQGGLRTPAPHLGCGDSDQPSHAWVSVCTHSSATAYL